MAAVDAAMVGHVDRVALAGFGIANSLIFVLTFFGVGIVLGLDTLVSQAIGRGDQDHARTLYRSGLLLAVRIGIPLSALGLALPLFLGVFGVEQAVADEARRYLYGRLPSILPYLIFTASASYLEALGRTRPIVVAMVIANLINLVADAVLVFGDEALGWVGLPALGLPALGSLGASLATCIVTICMAASVGYVIYRMPRPGAASGTPELRRKIARLGLPIGFHMLAEVGIFAIVGLLAGRLGAITGAAHQLAITLTTLTFSVALGMGAATSVRVGRAVGAGDHQAARQAGVVGALCAAVVMLCAGACLIFAPSAIAGVFADDPAVIAAAVPLLLVAALFQFSDAIQAVMAGALRGAGDNRATLLGNLLGHFGIGIWVGLGLGFGLDWGAVGLWWGLSAGLTATAVGLAYRFLRISSAPIAQA